MTQRYRTIVADPPWPFEDYGPRSPSRAGHWAERHDGLTSKVPYKTMALGEIAALPVAERWAANDAHLYLWTINRHLPAAYDVAAAWGFKPSQMLTWCKAPRGLGMGGAYVATTEFLLFCRRGSLKATNRVDSTWFQWKRPYENGAPAHSKKPDESIDLIEQVSPGPYLELFARRGRLGWDYWGDQSLGTAEMEAA